MWNYRLIKHEAGEFLDGTDNSWYSVHEVFYDHESHTVDEVGYTKAHVILGGRTKEDILSKLETIKRDVEALPDALSDGLIEPTDHGEDPSVYHWEYSVTDKKVWRRQDGLNK